MPTCKTCGLLAIRHYSSHEPIEVIEEWRRNGAYSGKEFGTFPAEFFCQSQCDSFPPRPKRGDDEPGVDQ